MHFSIECGLFLFLFCFYFFLFLVFVSFFTFACLFAPHKTFIIALSFDMWAVNLQLAPVTINYHDVIPYLIIFLKD